MVGYKGNAINYSRSISCYNRSSGVGRRDVSAFSNPHDTIFKERMRIYENKTTACIYRDIATVSCSIRNSSLRLPGY